MNRRSFVAAMSIGLTVGTSSVALAKRNTPSEGFDEINAEIDNVIDLCDRDISCLRVHSTRILQLVRQFKKERKLHGRDFRKIRRRIKKELVGFSRDVATD